MLCLCTHHSLSYVYDKPGKPLLRALHDPSLLAMDGPAFLTVQRPADLSHRHVLALQPSQEWLTPWIHTPQEKMSTMEAEIADKDRQLTALREENSSLAGRNAVLEKVLALRDEQLKQQGGAADTNQVPFLEDVMEFRLTLTSWRHDVAPHRPEQGACMTHL